MFDDHSACLSLGGDENFARKLDFFFQFCFLFSGYWGAVTLFLSIPVIGESGQLRCMLDFHLPDLIITISITMIHSMLMVPMSKPMPTLVAHVSTLIGALKPCFRQPHFAHAGLFAYTLAPPSGWEHPAWPTVARF